MKREKLITLVQCALVAALYTALMVSLAPLSFNAVQIRVAEALTLLAIFSKPNIAALTLGCAMSNAIGLFMGINPLGALDIVFGTIATLIAAILSYLLRNVRIFGLPVLSALSPVIINGIIIGAELCFVTTGTFALRPFAINAAAVAIGEIVPCLMLGLILVFSLEKTGLDKKLFAVKKAQE